MSEDETERWNRQAARIAELMETIGYQPKATQADVLELAASRGWSLDDLERRLRR